VTFSIIALDIKTKDLGIAVASGSIAVGTRVPWIKKNIGAIATQAYTNINYGIQGLRLLEQGLSPEEALKHLLSKDPEREKRQVGIIDIKNRKIVHTGKYCPYWNGHIVGENYIILGNLIRGEKVLNEMERAFKETKGHIALKLINALVAGEKAGGDRREDRSAAIVVKGSTDINLRIDEEKKPAQKLLDIIIESFPELFKNS